MIAKELYYIGAALAYNKKGEENKVKKYLLLICIIILSSCAKKYDDSERAKRLQKIADKMELIIHNINYPNRHFESDSAANKYIKDFNPNIFFTVLKNIKLKDDYVLDYCIDDNKEPLYCRTPILYARKAEEKPFKSLNEYQKAVNKLVNNNGKYESRFNNDNNYKFEKWIELKDNEESYFEYAVLNIYSKQFLNQIVGYNDWDIVCTKGRFDKIRDSINNYSHNKIEDTPITKSLEPIITRSGDEVTLSLCCFSKWKGLIRKIFKIKLDASHDFTKNGNLISPIQKGQIRYLNIFVELYSNVKIILFNTITMYNKARFKLNYSNQYGIL